MKDQKNWKSCLTEEQYAVTRCGGTERPFSGKYVNCKDDGIYACSCCGFTLFDSKTKYDSGSGWPSFWDAAKDNVLLKEDHSHSMIRTEVLCKNCNAHLGHLFDDGPNPTGLRYCINSLSLELKKRNEELGSKK